MSDDSDVPAGRLESSPKLDDELELDFEESGDWRGAQPKIEESGGPRGQTLQLKEGAYDPDAFRHIHTNAMSAIMGRAAEVVGPGLPGASESADGGMAETGDLGLSSQSAEPGFDREEIAPPLQTEPAAARPTTSPPQPRLRSTSEPVVIQARGTGSRVSTTASQSDPVPPYQRARAASARRRTLFGLVIVAIVAAVAWAFVAGPFAP